MLPFLPRLAGVAALLLVTFGLGLWLAPSAGVLPSSPMQLALLTPRDLIELPAAVRSRVEAKAFQLDGPVPGWNKRLAQARATDNWPAPPRVNRDLVLKNGGLTPVQVEIGGRDFACVMEVSGVEVIQRTIDRPARFPFARKSETIAPGGSLTLHIDRLASQIGERVVNIYPEMEGEYTLRVKLRAVGRREGRREVIRVEAGPMKLPVR
jgi:hypothetical protein